MEFCVPNSLVIISPKRRRPESSWNDCFPYYAGFPESFAREIIASAKLPTDGLVFDPWNGSGTTTYTASRLGYKSKGIDINPVMVLVARARALAPSEASSIEPQAKTLVRDINRIVGKDLEADPLFVWFSADTVRIIRALEKRICNALTDPKVGNAEEVFGSISCFASTFYVALFTICRKFTADFRSTNPTWLRVPRGTESKISLSAAEIASAFVTQAKTMAISLQGLSRDIEAGATEIEIGNSTNFNAFEPADLILGSPPYCTRIDYTATTRVELALINRLLAVPKEQLSREMMGSVRVPVDVPSPEAAWGETCAKFLQRLYNHESKASSGYYYKTHVDYFSKLNRSIVNVAKHLKRDASAVLVVQDSHYKEVHNDVPLIVTEMASRAGLKLDLRQDYRQNNSMSGINSRSKVYRKTVGATESVLCFRKIKRGQKA